MWAVLAAIVIAGMSLSAGAQTFDANDVPIAVVRVDNVVAVPADSLQFAEERAAYVFSLIGVDVRWISEDVAFEEHLNAPFTIVLVNAERNPRQAALIDETLAFADPGVHRAHVFYDRITALNVRSGQSPAIVLGDVIAHELGHLML